MSSDPGHGSAKVNLDLLLEHRSFVRALARRLVRDEASAEDLEQETWLTALHNPPVHARGIRGWLATVVRQLAWTSNRSATRRARRERAKATAEAQAGATPPEVLERAAWSQRVVAAVMELEEPYRSTVLLRYFEGLSGAEIAKLHDVPAATVRTRLRRGLERLRKRFDEEVEGGRSAWVLALAPLAFPVREAAAATASATAQTAAGKVPWVLAGTVALALVAAVAVHWAAGDRGAAPRSPGEGPLAVRRSAEGGSARGPDTPVDPELAEEAFDLEVTVLADGRPAAGARVRIERWVELPWRWRPGLSAKQAETGALGQARFKGLARGYVTVSAQARGYALATTVAFLPLLLESSVVLELAPEFPVRVRVIELGSEAPVAGAAVGQSRTLFDAPRTDERGEVVLAGLAPGARFRLQVTRDGFAAFGPHEFTVGEPIRVELEPRRREIAWPVLPHGRPADGTPIRLRRIGESLAEGRDATMREGEIVAGGFGAGEVPEFLAVAGDGTFARLRAEPGETRGGPTVAFSEPIVFDLTAVDDRGKPVAALLVELRDETSGTLIHPTGRTDPDGRLALPFYSEDSVEIFVGFRGVEGRRMVGRLDPAQPDGARVIVLPAGRMVELRGAGGAIYLGRQRVSQQPVLMARPEEIGETRVLVHVLERGYQPVSIEVDCSIAEPLVVEVDRKRAGSLRLPVLLREPDQPYQLELVDARDEARPLFRGPWRFRLHAGPDHVVREDMLPPGLYRVRDACSGKATPVFGAEPGETIEGMFLDLSDVERQPPESVRGWVEGYEDLELDRATVEVVGAGAERRLVCEVARDGSFTFPWPGWGTLRIRARHPSVAVGTTAEITLTEPREDIVLQLTPWNRAFVRLEPAPGPARRGATAPRVLVMRGAVAAGSIVGVIEGNQFRFAGHREGACGLWIDVPGFAPATLRRVQLLRGTTDLGTLELVRGSTLRLRILGSEGSAPDALLVSAQALDGPRYQRSLKTVGEERATLSGLGPGAFRVTAWETSTGRRVWSERVRVDGRTALDLEIDLR